MSFLKIHFDVENIFDTEVAFVKAFLYIKKSQLLAFLGCSYAKSAYFFRQKLWFQQSRPIAKGVSYLKIHFGIENIFG